MAAPSGVLWIDGVDAATLGLAVTGLGDLWAGPSRSRSVLEPHDVYGAIPAPSAEGEPRRVRMRMALIEQTVSGRRASLDDVHQLLAPGAHEVRFGDAPDRVLFGVFEGIGGESLTGASDAWRHGDMSLPCELVCYDPLRYDRYDRVLGLGTTAVEVDLGPMPASAGARVDLFGAATSVVDPVVHLMRGRTRETYATLTLTGATLTADDTAEIHLGEHDVVLVESDVRTRDRSLVAVGGGGFPALQPGRDGKVYVKLTASSGTPTGRLRYRRAYP